MSHNSLKHLAIIMDGNGRWAIQKGKPRISGHIAGMETAQKIVSYISQTDIPYLTLFAFSAENSLRPKKEVYNLINLFRKALSERSSFFQKMNIRFHVLGNIDFFSKDIKDFLNQLVEQTKDHGGLNLILALNYGGQQEITQGMKKLIQKVEEGEVKSEIFDKDILHSFLPSSQFPAPDLILRTGGCKRLSNFYLWSSAYSEICFKDILWPDFNEDMLQQEIEQFFVVKRNFGKKVQELR